LSGMENPRGVAVGRNRREHGAGRSSLALAAVLILALFAAQPASAGAQPPDLTIESPANGSVSNNREPSFSGVTDDPLDAVTVKIYSGSSIGEGEPLQTLSSPLPPAEGTWALGPAAPLADGVYTAQAAQTNFALETGTSSPVTFTVDTSSPTVTLESPPSPSNDTTPSFSGTASDTTTASVKI